MCSKVLNTGSLLFTFSSSRKFFLSVMGLGFSDIRSFSQSRALFGLPSVSSGSADSVLFLDHKIASLHKETRLFSFLLQSINAGRWLDSCYRCQNQRDIALADSTLVLQ
ncbi:hypothetical protein ABFS82_14G216600 [Erythranthe guttata]